jgi:tripeptide aminopeptidase
MKHVPELLARGHTPTMVERFIAYAKYYTTSDRHIDDIPSTPNQRDLARRLQSELESMGIRDIDLDEHCYLIARIPASPGFEKIPCIGLMAHIDTASDVTGENVKPRVISGYDGASVSLSPGYTLDPADNPDLREHVGDTIIVTDGTTLLGADDKAGIAEIMTAAEYLLCHPDLKHGPIEIVFTPDEETGKGMNLFPLKKLRSVACYTLDGGKAAEIEAECFTAYQAHAEFTGKVIHIGAARGKLANAVSMAGSFISMLPRNESPEATDEWYGYYCPLEMSGGLEKSVVDVFLRDFTDSGMERRIATVKALAAAVEAQFPLGSVRLDIRKQYLNMRKKLDERPEVLEKLMDAVRRAGADPYIKPIRGGTDGARLTEMGIPTPNIFTGGYNYHSRYEWASVAEMALAVDTIVELVQLWAE